MWAHTYIYGLPRDEHLQCYSTYRFPAIKLILKSFNQLINISIDKYLLYKSDWRLLGVRSLVKSMDQMLQPLAHTLNI